MGSKAFHNLSLQVYIQLLYLYAFYGLVYSVLLIISKSSHALLNLLPCLNEALLWNALSPNFSSWQNTVYTSEATYPL